MPTPVSGLAHSDLNVIIHDDADSTKQLKFQLSAIATGTTRTITVPDLDLTLIDVSSVTLTGGTIDDTVIGGTTPAAGSLTTLDTSGAVVFNEAGADVDFRVEGDTDANLFFVNAGADTIGIGDGTATRAKLTVTGSVSTDNGAYGFLNSAGTIGTASGAVTTSIFADSRVVCSEINANSDARIKVNITPVENAIDKLKKLNVVGYNKQTKDGTAMGEYGFIGQEVAKTLPLALRVSEGDVPDGSGGWKIVEDFHQINYQTIFALAVKAIQEQQSQIEELKQLLEL